MANLYDKAGLVNIPVGYQDGFLYNIKPEDNTLGFRFNRDSAATRVNKEGLIEQVGYFGPELVQNGNFSELGSELVVNGDFATDSNWNLVGSTISISDGKLNFVNAITNTEFAQQSIVAPIGKVYKITLEVSNLSGGDSIKIRYPFQDISINTNGTHTLYGVGVTANFFRITPNSTTATFSIDNVSVKQVDPNDYWNLGTGWSFGDGIVEANNTSSFISQSGLIEASKLYRLTFEARLKSGTNGTINAYIGGSNNQQFTIANTDWQSFTYEDTRGSSTADSIYFNNNGTELELDNISVVEILGDKPRIDYTDSLTSPSFLLEPQSTNLISYSEDFSQSYWIKDNVLIESGYTAPDGGNNAYKVTKNGGNAHLIVLGSTVSSLNRHKSIWARTVSGTGTVQLLNHNSDTSNIFTLTTQWQRFDIAHGGLFNHFYAVDFRGAGTTLDEVIIWGAQLEDQSYAISYIPTAGTTATRAQETCNGAGNASTFNSTEGVLYAEIAALADDLTDRRITISNSSNTAQLILIEYETQSNTLHAFLYDGSFQAEFTHTLNDITTFVKVAFKFKENDFALWVDGFEVASDNSGSVFANNTLDVLKFENSVSLNKPFYGKPKQIQYFDTTDIDLEQLTSWDSFRAMAEGQLYTIE